MNEQDLVLVSVEEELGSVHYFGWEEKKCRTYKGLRCPDCDDRFGTLFKKAGLKWKCYKCHKLPLN